MRPPPRPDMKGGNAKAEAPQSNGVQRCVDSLVYFDRVAKSLAHNVGNSIHVVCGRLTLLEQGADLDADSKNILQLIRDRLMRTSSELRLLATRAPRISETLSLHDLLNQLSAVDAIHIEGIELLHDDPLSVPDGQVVVAALRLLSGMHAVDERERQPAWKVSVSDEFVHLRVPVAKELIRSRRALLSPWFETCFEELPEADRASQITLAAALGKLEESGAAMNVIVQEGEKPACSHIELCWLVPQLTTRTPSQA